MGRGQRHLARGEYAYDRHRCLSPAPSDPRRAWYWSGSADAADRAQAGACVGGGFLASDMAQDITGWTVGISGDRLSLIEDPGR